MSGRSLEAGFQLPATCSGLSSSLQTLLLASPAQGGSLSRGPTGGHLPPDSASLPLPGAHPALLIYTLTCTPSPSPRPEPSSPCSPSPAPCPRVRLGVPAGPALGPRELSSLPGCAPSPSWWGKDVTTGGGSRRDMPPPALQKQGAPPQPVSPQDQTCPPDGPGRLALEVASSPALLPLCADLCASVAHGLQATSH